MAGDNEVAEKNQIAKEGESSARDTAESARNELFTEAYQQFKSSDASKTELPLGGKSDTTAGGMAGKDSNSDIHINTPEDLIGPGTQDGPKSPDEHWYLRGVGKGGEGDHELPTGDRLHRDSEGNETLTTPDGTKLTVNKDGTYKIDGPVSSVEEDKDGGRTVTFPDGSKVKFGPGGIQQVSRGKDMVKFIVPGAKLPAEPDDPLKNPFKFPPRVNPRG